MARGFYEKFGEDVTNELVNWFNAVDTTYKADIKHINEQNTQRFEATLKQGLADLRADLIKWMFTFWVPTAIGIVATAGGVVGLLLKR